MEEKKIEETPKKPKRVLSEKQKEALARGRAKAHERLREFRKNKSSIEKSDEPIKEEPKKEVPKQTRKQKITKEDVNYGDSDEREEFAQIHNKIVDEEEEEEKIRKLKETTKKRKPKKKQVVIVEESSSSSEEEQVIVRRSKRKNKISQPIQQEQTQQVQRNIPKQSTLLFY